MKGCGVQWPDIAFLALSRKCDHNRDGSGVSDQSRCPPDVELYSKIGYKVSVVGHITQ